MSELQSSRQPAAVTDRTISFGRDSQKETPARIFSSFQKRGNHQPGKGLTTTAAQDHLLKGGRVDGISRGEVVIYRNCAGREEEVERVN